MRSLDARALVLELTEGVACQDPAAARTVLMRLRALGIRISIDDFGTGYSSLSYLGQFPVDALKVDRSFVRSITTQHESAAIIGTVAAMARQLGLHIVAEGVERGEQAQALLSLHCDSGQGYLFAPPLDADAATEILHTGISRSDAIHHATRATDATEIADTTAPIGATRAIGTVTTSPATIDVGTSSGAKTASLRFPFSGRWLAVAAAAGVVLALAGVVNRFARDLGALAPTPERSRTAASPAGDTRAPAPSPEGPARTALPSPSSVPTVREPEARSFQIQHLHRLGSCGGRLRVSYQGLLFTPEEKSSNEGFLLAHGEFLPSTSGQTLTIKSHAKTYRFRASTDRRRGRDTSDTASQLQALTATLDRFR